MWCLENRGDFFLELIKGHNPKYILCTGKAADWKFFQFFKCDRSPAYYRSNELVDIEVRQIPGTNSYVIVSAFFGGPSGINSFEKMRALTALIKETIAEIDQ